MNKYINKEELIDFFNKLAPNWDQRRDCEEDILDVILDKADIVEDKTVLDIACGTGSLIPFYLKRNVKEVMGVDISDEMIRIAKEKHKDNCVRFICGDATVIKIKEKFDCCMVCNALPHMGDPEVLIKNIKIFIKENGRLTIAHDMNKDKLNELHSRSAHSVSVSLIDEDELADIMSKWFDVDTIIADDKMYIVSGILRIKH